MNLQFFILLETLMHKIAQETINSNFSQNAMNRNRSRKKQKKTKKKTKNYHSHLGRFTCMFKRFNR